MSRFFVVGVFVFLTLGPLAVLAANDSLDIRLFYGEDVQAPTVPSPVTVEPIADSQIDIAWGTSTDDYGVAGYQLFRDAVQIATTTLTAFSDTGLTASTTYSYYVVAFDDFSNFSSSSVTVATTTFQTPIIVPPTPATTTPATGSDGTLARLQLTAFQITPSTNGAYISFVTNVPSRYLIRFGTTSVFDDGTLESIVYTRDHSTSLFPLVTGTRYEYELYGYDRFGHEVLLKRDSFVTLTLPDTNAPANVSNFTAVPMGNDVYLRWDNPTETDFVYVRVLRNHLFYPSHVSDGFIVYEGTARSATDVAALAQYDAQYYTVFSYDASGNISSGAVATAVPYVVGTQPSTPPDTILPPEVIVDLGDDSILYAESVQLFQGEERQSLSDREIVLTSGVPFRIVIPVTAVATNLKSIIVTVTDPTDQRLSSSYLLKRNGDVYEALIQSAHASGRVRLTVEVFDYTQATVRRISTLMTFVDAAVVVESDTQYRYATVREWVTFGGLLIGLCMLLGFGWLIFFARRREDNR